MITIEQVDKEAIYQPDWMQFVNRLEFDAKKTGTLSKEDLVREVNLLTEEQAKILLALTMYSDLRRALYL